MWMFWTLKLFYRDSCFFDNGRILLFQLKFICASRWMNLRWCLKFDVRCIILYNLETVFNCKENNFHSYFVSLFFGSYLPSVIFYFGCTEWFLVLHVFAVHTFSTCFFFIAVHNFSRGRKERKKMMNIVWCKKKMLYLWIFTRSSLEFIIDVYMNIMHPATMLLLFPKIFMG